jgi:predicted  nucleic acid-binding Zn-ribbon protein
MAIHSGALRELHRIHTQLSDLREQIERGPKQVRARQANVVAAEQKLAAAQHELKLARVAADQKNLQLKSSEVKIEDYKNKLNASQSNREYQALKDQIAASEMAGSVLQDEILEILEKIDSHKRDQTDAETNLAKTKEDLAKFAAQVKEAEAGLQSEFTRVESMLKEAESGLPPDLMVAYERIVKSKGADALAEVENDSCNGCYQQCTPNMQSDLRLGKPVFCKSCGRLLYEAENLGRSLKKS